MPDFPIPLPDELESTARVGVRVNGGVTTLRRRRVNFLNTSAVTWTAADDPVNEEVDLTLAFTSDMATQAELDAHLNDTSDAHDASAVSFSPTGTVAATDVQAAIAEVASEIPAGVTTAGARVATSQSTTSTSYTDLATSGPAVTVTTGTSVLVTVGARIDSDDAFMSFAVSGASTVAADDTRALIVSNTATTDEAHSRQVVLTGLTAGSNTFTAKYKSATGGTIAFAARDLSVITLS